MLYAIQFINWNTLHGANGKKLYMTLQHQEIYTRMAIQRLQTTSNPSRPERGGVSSMSPEGVSIPLLILSSQLTLGDINTNEPGNIN